MKKISLFAITACMFMALSPTQLKANSEMKPISAIEAKTVQTTDQSARLVRIDQIETNSISVLNSSEKEEALKESLPMKNDQGRHGRGYERRHSDVNVVVSDRPHRDYNRHGGTVYYTAGGGLLLILILILIL